MPDSPPLPKLPLDRLPLTSATVDRAAGRRGDDTWLAQRWDDPTTRVLVVAETELPVLDGALQLVGPRDAPPGDRLLLGEHDGVAYFAVASHDRIPGGLSLREASLVLDDQDAGLAVHAVALANWHATHACCPRCGTPTEVVQAGHARRCPRDGSMHFPRTDPAVIMLVRDDDDRALMGRASAWPRGRFSTLAGFVEPGESLEQAVVREVREETGVVCVDPVYAGSQPHPFPASLMVGFYARAVNRDIDVDGEEMAEARWFARDDIVPMVESGELRFPPSNFISRRLIEGWYGGPIPAP